MFRIALDIGLILTFLLFPWWVSFVIAVVASIFYKKFFEIIVLGIFTDLFFGAGSATLWGIPFFYTLFYTGIFIVTYILEQYIRPNRILS